LPISGEGAAIRGGRFNRVGQKALYLSLEIGTAIAECSQGFASRIPPMTICEYDLDCDPVADLSDEATKTKLEVLWHELECPWLADVSAGRDPASWRLVDRLMAQRYIGIIVPSFAPGTDGSQRNLVLWNWGEELPAMVRVFDPGKRLPHDRTSWSA